MDDFTGDNSDINAVKEKRTAKMQSPKIDLDIEFVPNNPYTLTVDTEGLGKSHAFEGNEVNERPGFFRTAYEEAKEFNVTSQGFHSLFNKIFEPVPSVNKNPYTQTLLDQLKGGSSLMDIPPSDWNPKSDPSKFIDIKDQYLNYAMQATGPKDLDYRLERIREEQHHNEILENGSLTARILGGIAGVITDPVSYIPIIGAAKYAKFGPQIFRSAANALPGVATYAVLQSAAEQSDKINGNLTDFFKNAALNTVFGTALFGLGGAVGLSVEKMNLWNLQKYAKEYIDGIDFKLKVDEKGKLIGLHAVDTTGSLSAAKVSFAQDMADSEFGKAGLFKIPYLGRGIQEFLSMPFLGAPLPKLLNSKFKSFVAFIDRSMDHGILTKGVLEGKTSPIKFQTLMDQEYAGLRVLHAQLSALHLERNGFKIENRAIQGLASIGLTAKNKGLEALGKDLDKTDYISREVFDSEVERVLYTQEPSEHAAVNEAAGLIRPKLDNTYKAWRKAYNLPEDWLPPKTAVGYLMRVYDTPYLNTNQDKWVQVISNFLRDSDQIIESRLQPIRDIEEQIARHKESHEALIRDVNRTDKEVSRSVDQIIALKAKKKALDEALQNELRENPDLQLHVEDWNALSTKEAEELKQFTKRRDIAEKEIDEQKKYIADMKAKIAKSKSSAMKAKTVATGKKQIRRSDIGELALKKEEDKLRILEKEHLDELEKIQQAIMNNQVNPRFYTKEKDSARYILRDPNERLKFRKTYESHADREIHAKAYYDTIMNQTAEDTINQVMGKLIGNNAENHIKSRTLMVPDKLLYDNGFMAKELMPKVGNYVTYLARRTHLKNVFNDVTLDGGVAPLLEHMNGEYEELRKPLNERKSQLEKDLANAKADEEKKKIQKSINKADKQLARLKKEFEKTKERWNHVYEKMMGIKKIDKKARQIQSLIMSFTAMANLPFVPFTMINDLSANGLQHGIWPFIRDGVYPIAQSIAGLLKTKDSEALRKTAPSVALAMQDVLNGYADRNWSMYTEPFLNLNRWVSGVEKLAHFSSNFTLTNYFDNGLQRIAGSICQAEFMRILHAFKDKTMTEKEGLYLRKYGIDPEKWADRMIAAFKQDGGGKTAIGGYKANFWHWQDMEAANEFSNAVFRGIKQTTIQRGLIDSPFWADNLIGSLVHGFNGWTYASVNRYVIPSMQAADAHKLLGVLFMLGTGYFVSPFRRIARGEDPFPENQTAKQRFFETVQDSGYFSYFSNILADANIASGGSILSDFKNDRYRDRTRVGLLGPSFGTANKMADIISATASREMNQTDLKKLFRMLPVFNASWTWRMSKKLAESTSFPETRAQAKALKRIS